MIATALAGLALAVPAPARAWGDEGHRIIALIAERLLTPAAHRQVDALLAADTDSLTAPDFASRATWADKWRNSDRYGSKVRYLATWQWHFVDIELDRPSLKEACFDFPSLPTGTAASAGPAHDCVVDKVEQFASELGDPATSQGERILALKFLLHLVGDLHQPLHAADHHDYGGNAVMVLLGRRTVAIRLHAYWDNTVVAKLGRNPQVIADALLAGAEKDAAEWSAGTPRTWAMETFGVARDVTYRLPAAMVTDAHGAPAYRLDAAYESASEAAARPGRRSIGGASQSCDAMTGRASTTCLASHKGQSLLCPLMTATSRDHRAPDDVGWETLGVISHHVRGVRLNDGIVLLCYKPSAGGMANIVAERDNTINVSSVE